MAADATSARRLGWVLDTTGSTALLLDVRGGLFHENAALARLTSDETPNDATRLGTAARTMACGMERVSVN